MVSNEFTGGKYPIGNPIIPIWLPYRRSRRDADFSSISWSFFCSCWYEDKDGEEEEGGGRGGWWEDPSFSVEGIVCCRSFCGAVGVVGVVVVVVVVVGGVGGGPANACRKRFKRALYNK